LLGSRRGYEEGGGGLIARGDRGAFECFFSRTIRISMGGCPRGGNNNVYHHLRATPSQALPFFSISSGGWREVWRRSTMGEDKYVRWLVVSVLVSSSFVSHSTPFQKRSLCFIPFPPLLQMTSFHFPLRKHSLGFWGLLGAFSLLCFPLVTLRSRLGFLEASVFRPGGENPAGTKRLNLGASFPFVRVFW
jgi:hypothetical protein